MGFDFEQSESNFEKFLPNYVSIYLVLKDDERKRQVLGMPHFIRKFIRKLEKHHRDHESWSGFERFLASSMSFLPLVSCCVIPLRRAFCDCPDCHAGRRLAGRRVRVRPAQR